MANKEPALFYFWAHDVIEELKTDTCKALVERADVIFVEGVTHDVSISAEIEKDFNKYSIEGILSDKLRGNLEGRYDPQGEFLLSLTKGTPKKYVLEKYPAADFDFIRDQEVSEQAFLMYNLERAMEIRESFLLSSEAYNIPREKTAAGKIAAIEGTVLAIFGAAHPDIRKMVAISRPTEAHFPYPDYPESYSSKEMTYFRRVGVLDKEFFLRSGMEMIARRAVMQSNLSLSGREQELLVHKYAGLVPLEKIAGYKDYLNFCTSFSGASPQDIFESFLKKEGLPLVPEVLAEIRKV